MVPEHVVPHRNPVTGIRGCWKHKQAETSPSLVLPGARNQPHIAQRAAKPGLNQGRSSWSSWGAAGMMSSRLCSVILLP